MYLMTVYRSDIYAINSFVKVPTLEDYICVLCYAGNIDISFQFQLVQ